MKLLPSLLSGLLLASLWCATSSASPEPTKEWTYMIFLDGNNNLDTYGQLNIRQLETVGSTKDINIVVQWASLASTVTKRLLVTKSTDPAKVTSPTVQEMPRVDMGDYRNLIEFVRWTVQKYPAKHYFISMWDHGGGWHVANGGLPSLAPLDISYDEISGKWITTAEFGLAMAEAAKIMGHKVDIVGSDACLMAMVEVNDEMSDSVQVAIASEELIPGLGWPYDKLIAGWAAKPLASPADLSKILTDEYVKYFQLPSNPDEVTLSSADLGKSVELDKALFALSSQIQKLNPADVEKFKQALAQSQAFSSADYVDLGDLTLHLATAGIPSLGADVLAPVRQALAGYVIDSRATKKFVKATGVSLWLPTEKFTYDLYAAKYASLHFNVRTGWSKALEWLLKP